MVASCVAGRSIAPKRMCAVPIAATSSRFTAALCSAFDWHGPVPSLPLRLERANIEQRRNLTMADVHFVYNSCEISIWAIFGIGFLAAAVGRSGGPRTRCYLAALAFFLFAASDAVELHTGAWWRPWWLFAWKALCVVVLLGLYVENVVTRMRRVNEAGPNEDH
jgi:hypothetical protein